MPSGFTDLKVYKKSRVFRKAVAAMVKTHFPKEEEYRLKAQIINASRSITANIAEGYGRFYYQDTIRFCRIARGSLEESMEHLITAYDETYITSEELKEFKSKYDDCLKLLNGYISYLKRTKKGENDDDSE